MRSQPIEEVIIVGMIIITSFLICGRLGYNLAAKDYKTQIENICHRYAPNADLCTIYGRE